MVSFAAASLNSTGELISYIEKDQRYYSDDTSLKELLKALENESYLSLGQAVYDRAFSRVFLFNILTRSVRRYVSGLSSLDARTAPAITKKLRSVLELFHLDEDYLSNLYDMGQLSPTAFTCHSFSATVSQGGQYIGARKSQEVMKLQFTLKTICDQDVPVTNLGSSFNHVKVFHRLDRAEDRALWLVMEDSYTSFRDPPRIGEWYSFVDQFGSDGLLRVSVLETVRYCELALKGWKMALDEIEERIWTAVSRKLIRSSCTFICAYPARLLISPRTRLRLLIPISLSTSTSS